MILRALLLATMTAAGAAPLATAAKGPVPARPAGDRLIVAYEDGISAARRGSARDGAEALRALRGRSGVRYAERDVLDHVTSVPNDPAFGSLWNMARIGAPQA